MVVIGPSVRLASDVCKLHSCALQSKPRFNPTQRNYLPRFRLVIMFPAMVLIVLLSFFPNFSSEYLLKTEHHTVEPPNKGHFGNRSFVLCLEVVPISEVQLYNPQIML